MRVSRLLLIVVLVLLLVPATALTVARFAEPEGGRWVRLVSFTPFAVPLYAVAVVLLALGGWRARGAARVGCRVLAVALVLPLALHLYVASGPFLGGAAAAAGAGKQVRVMTMNLGHGEADTARVMALAVANRVDMLVVQEVTTSALQALTAAGVAEAFPYRVGAVGEGPSGTMVFSVDRLTGASRLDTHYGGWSMEARLGGTQVRLLAVHPYAPVGDAEPWRADHQAVLRAAADLGPAALVVGDFNATMDHRPMRELVGRGLADAATVAGSGWQPTWPSMGEVRVLGLQVPSLLAIDHVLMGEQVRATRTESVTVPGTDHRALLVTLVL